MIEMDVYGEIQCLTVADLKLLELAVTGRRWKFAT